VAFVCAIAAGTVLLMLPVCRAGPGSAPFMTALFTATSAITTSGMTADPAAAQPTAGLTALRMLEVAGPVLGKRVLVTGATGGTGRLAVQLAQLAGARVTALVRDRAASDGPLRRLGADDVVARHASAVSDLQRLCALVADGRLDCQIVLEDSWRNATGAMEALLGRRVAGRSSCVSTSIRS
jgi:D-arabinose 1-dehydrogenase-like Zn-dependent alcohol dehydrogenase